MNALDSWLAQYRRGEIDAFELMRLVRDAVATGTLDRATLRRWLVLPSVRAALTADLARDLAQVAAIDSRSVDPSRRSATDPRIQTVSVGSVIDGRYELMDLLGGGGMGDVFKALDLLAHKQQDPDPYVAVKILKPKLQGNDKAVLALQREANRARRLTHPNILRIHQFEQDRATGLYFIVMELLEGSSLETVLESNWAGEAWADIAGRVGQICAGLECAHQEHLIHSDIKPGNLFLTRRGQIKILDFGIAAPMPTITGDAHQTRMDARKFGARTPAYASLEMFLGLKAHYSDDVYSLGCVVYQWLSGRYPYVEVDDPSTPVPAPKAVKLGLRPAPVRGLTRGQNHALRKALALRRSDRTQTVAEFWQSMNVTRSVWPSAQMGAAAAGVVLAGALLLGASWLLPRRQDPPLLTPTDVAEATPLTSCPGPASVATLDAALAVATEARSTLARQRHGSQTITQAQSRLRAAVKCLQALADAGVSNGESISILRELKNTAALSRAH